MQIKYRRKYINKTYKYLFPCLQSYGAVFSMKIKDIFILGCGIGDMAIENNSNFDFTGKRPIFILIDKLPVKNKSENFIFWIKYQPYFIKDYPMDIIGRSHMIILDFPEKYSNAYDKFLIGKYSEMFTKTDLEKLFDKDTYEYNVLTKDKSLVPIFIEKLKKTFEVQSIKEEDLLNSELELPYNLQKEEEWFNTGLPL